MSSKCTQKGNVSFNHFFLQQAILYHPKVARDLIKAARQDVYYNGWEAAKLSWWRFVFPVKPLPGRANIPRHIQKPQSPLLFDIGPPLKDKQPALL